MKKYFEYEFNEDVRQKMIAYYNSKKGRDDLDDTYGKVAFKLDRIKDHIPYNSQDYICDVGCSDGALLRHLTGRYAKGMGLDISENVIQANRARQDEGVTYDTYDGKNIAQKNEFDKVFLMDVLEHAFEPDELISSIHDSLKVGGYLIMQVPTTGWLSELLAGKYHFGHLRYYDQFYLRKYLEKNGFDVVYIDTFNSVPLSTKIIHYPKMFHILNALCNLMPHTLYPWFGSVAAVATRKE